MVLKIPSFSSKTVKPQARPLMMNSHTHLVPIAPISSFPLSGLDAKP